MQAKAQGPGRPDVPEKIQVPPGEQLVLKVRASGSQIYICRQGTDGKPAWSLKAPEAELRDDQGQIIGHHYAGPSWKHNDGSEITGKAAAGVDSPDPNSIPWLLINVTGHSGAQGVLSRITTVQRIHTSGGQPPVSGCDASKQNSEVKSSYTADYYFYAPVR